MADDKEKEKVPVTEVLEEDDEFEVRPWLVLARRPFDLWSTAEILSLGDCRSREID